MPPAPGRPTEHAARTGTLARIATTAILAAGSLRLDGGRPSASAPRLLATGLVLAAALAGVMGCGDAGGAPRDRVRARLEALSPVANLGHRGTGPTRPGHALPENSLPSYQEAIAQGADGIELDLELTADGRLVVMHDDTLERTTTCRGCVSDFTLEEIRSCRLLAALPPAALVNAELKVFGDECRRAAAGPDALAGTALADVRRLGAEDRVLFSSFDPAAVAAVRAQSEAYVGLLLNVSASLDWEAAIRRALSLDADAIHPFLAIPTAGVAAARGAGLQVNAWTVDRPEDMEAMIAAGATAIITDEPGRLRGIVRAHARATARGEPEARSGPPSLLAADRPAAGPYFFFSRR